MRVKRYLVSSMPEAMSQIRSELGKNAVILSTKDIKMGGFLGMFGKRRIEVVAAVESGAAAAAAETKVRQPVASAPEAAASSEAVAAPSVTSHTAAAQYKSTGISDGNLQGAAAPERTAVIQHHTESRPLEQDLLREVRDLKTWIRQLSPHMEAPLPSAAGKLLKRLEEQEVSVVLREKLLSELQEREDFDMIAEDDASMWEASRKHLLKWLEPYSGGSPLDSSRVLHFVGPTGVGKTTTIAKVAADLTLRSRRSVGLITSDTYRIAAVDQLRTYADILGVPLEVVFSPAEAARAFLQLEEKDCVLMDTAGRNYRSELQVHEVNSLLRSDPDADTCLVLSMTARTVDMETVAEPFIRHGVNKVIFTKLDETTVYGAALNLVLEHGLRPVYVTFGQTVPDDLELFRTPRYVSLLLGDYPDA